MSNQRKFKEHVLNLVQTINELGNPFLQNIDELLTLDTRNVMDVSVVNTVRKVYDLGKEQYESYQKQVIMDRTRSIQEPFNTKTTLPPFNL